MICPCEQFGLLDLRFRLQTSGDSLVTSSARPPSRWARRLTLPAARAPDVDAREDPSGADGVDVDVRVTLPAVGTLIAYHGRIQVDTTSA